MDDFDSWTMHANSIKEGRRLPLFSTRSNRYFQVYNRYSSFIVAIAIILGGIFAGLLSFVAIARSFENITTEMWICFGIAIGIIVVGGVILVIWWKKMQNHITEAKKEEDSLIEALKPKE